MDRQRILAENRAKALERLKQRKRNISNAGESTANVTTNNATPTSDLNSKKPKIVLTPGQKQMLDKVRYASVRDASKQSPAPIDKQMEKQNENRKRFERPSIKKSDYIDYDFSTMKDTYGGFIADEEGTTDISSGGKTLEEWQQDKKQIIKDPAPPIDIRNAPKCHECKSIEIDPKFLEIFGCRVCRKCKEKYPEKYSLLTKTECREDYLLTDPELKDVDLFKRIIKPNPYSGTYSVMQLFLRYQIEEYAFKKWGSEEGLDKEWQRREEMKIARKDKKYEAKLKDMRKRLRAQEYTRRLKGEDLSGNGLSRGRHEHDWSKAYPIADKPNTVMRRCIDCGLETEEILL